MSTKFFFIVGGHEYQGNLGFLTKCNNRVTERIRVLVDTKDKNPYELSLPTDLVFVRIAVGHGSFGYLRYRFDSDSEKLHMTEKGWISVSPDKLGATLFGTTYSIGPFVAPTYNDYYHYVYKKHQHSVFKYVEDNSKEPTHFVSDPTRDKVSRYISMLHVYDLVRQAPASSVLELSIFSHGYRGGPIIMNSTDQRDDPGTTYRWGWDLDGRGVFDFGYVNEKATGRPFVTNDLMGDGTDTTHLSKFKAAFDPKAQIHIWGCNAATGTRNQFQRIRRLPHYRNGTMADTETIREQKIVSDGADGLKTIWEDHPFLNVKIRYAQNVQETFHYRCFKATGIETHGAMPGTGSQNTGSELMYIPSNRLFVNNFYRETMGFNKFDDWGYGIFDAGTTKAVEDVANMTTI